MHDFIIGMTELQFDPMRCISCSACIEKYKQLSVEALRMDKNRSGRTASPGISS
ncbi:hypothetical protein [uncultured Megasphaera sp.]|uniref:hypothetical protein n=1 Tax=uncultured Megasphaera sp. TaxID=165188 RepID=UPI0025F6ED62|nr:hypothetical protein [uncultured Megasphaera sp.]